MSTNVRERRIQSEGHARVTRFTLQLSFAALFVGNGKMLSFNVYNCIVVYVY